ncbi:hypothetical protein B9057_03695 [Aestuarium zhoushanense]|nr:hypothetical protein B9057_03695 [Aestuarium zhoushanense]
MPYEWIDPVPEADAPLAELHLWPYRSLPKAGFVWFVGGTVSLLSLPLLAVIGTAVLWGLLPFILLVTWAMWAALQRSYRDGEILEELLIWSDHLTLTRHNPRKPTQNWEANPYWVRLTRHATGGPVPEYLTMKGQSDREVEIGAFLTVSERKRLYSEIREALDRCR